MLRLWRGQCGTDACTSSWQRQSLPRWGAAGMPERGTQHEPERGHNPVS